MTNPFREQRDAYLLGLLRLLLSSLLLLNTLRLVSELVHNGYFGDFFHIPMLSESLLPSKFGYAFVLGIQALAAVCAILALWPRAALFCASSLGLFLLTLDRLQYHNNRYALLLLCFLLAFTPCDRSFSIVRRKPQASLEAQRLAPTWARRLFQFQVSLVYLGSACGKLLDPDWRGGQVLMVRFATTGEFWAARGIHLPSGLITLLSSAIFASFSAKIAISTELFIALGAWFPRTRRLALWLGVWFHISIELSARVELFSYLMVSSYLAFVVPELRQRRFTFNPESARGKSLARVLGWLDWCARFQITPVAGSDTFTVTNRQGQSESGLRGAALVAEAVPALFPLWLPLALFARARPTRETLSSV